MHSLDSLPSSALSSGYMDPVALANISLPTVEAGEAVFRTQGLLVANQTATACGVGVDFHATVKSSRSVEVRRGTCAGNTEQRRCHVAWLTTPQVVAVAMDPAAFEVMGPAAVVLAGCREYDGDSQESTSSDPCSTQGDLPNGPDGDGPNGPTREFALQCGPTLAEPSLVLDAAPTDLPPAGALVGLRGLPLEESLVYWLPGSAHSTPADGQTFVSNALGMTSTAFVTDLSAVASDVVLLAMVSTTDWSEAGWLTRLAQTDGQPTAILWQHTGMSWSMQQHVLPFPFSVSGAYCPGAACVQWTWLL